MAQGIAVSLSDAGGVRWAVRPLRASGGIRTNIPNVAERRRLWEPDKARRDELRHLRAQQYRGFSILFISQNRFV